MENNFKYIVYQTINIINNKIYIGVHRVKDPNIFCGYIGCGVNINRPSTYMKPTTPFQYAVKKYGTSNFRRSILFVFDSEKLAYDKEAEIVNRDFINRKDTYNASLGGKHPHFIGKKVYQFDRKGNLIKCWNSIYDASEFLETWKESIYSAIFNKSRLYNFYWSYYETINIKEYSSPSDKQKVFKYSRDGKCTDIYDSILQAAKLNNTTPNHIINIVKEGHLTKSGYYLSYELLDEYVPKVRYDLKTKNIFLYDLEGNFIKEVSAKEFKKKSDRHTYKELSNAILNKSTIIGFQIRLEKLDKIEPYSPKNKRKSVCVYKIDGSFVKEYDSVSGACKDLSLDSSTVHKILRGCAKQTKGYIIKYKN